MKKKLFLLGCGPGFDVMSSGHAATTTDSCHLQISGNNTAPATQFAAVTASPRDLVNRTNSTEILDYTHYSSLSTPLAVTVRPFRKEPMPT